MKKLLVLLALLFPFPAHADLKGVIQNPLTVKSSGSFSSGQCIEFANSGTVGALISAASCSSMGGDTITSPNSTITVGGTSTNTTLDVTQLAGNTITNGKWCISNGTIINCTTNSPVTTLTGDGYLISNSGSTGATTLTQNAHTANTVAGALTATTLSDLALPSCSAAGDALYWTSGTGFECATGFLTSSTGVTTFSAGPTGFTPSSATSGAITLGGTLSTSSGGLGANEGSATGVVQMSSGTTNISTALANGTTATTQSALDSSTKVATTAYTDNAVQTALNGLDWKEAVGYASTANIVCTNVSGVCTYTATGTDTVDGHTLALNDQLLLKNQTNQPDNGIWVVTTAGSLGVAGVLTRRSDYNTAADIQQGDALYVINGTVNSGTAWVQTDVVTTINSSNIAFTQVAGPGAITAGTNIVITGNSVATTTTPTFSTINGDVLTPGTWTLNGSAGKTLDFTASLTLSGVDGTVMTFPSSSANLAALNVNQAWTAPQSWQISSTVASAPTQVLDDVSDVAETTTITGNTNITTAKGFNKISLYTPTYSSSLPVTITNASNLYVDSAPVASTFVTILHPWAISVGSGNVSFPGTANVLGTISSATWNGTAIANTYGGTGQNSSASSGVAQLSSGTWSFSNALVSGVTASTQAALDNSAKVATTAYTDAAVAVLNDYTTTAGSYVTTATAAGTTTLTATSGYQQYFTGSTTQTVKLPVTSTLVTGQSYWIVNNSTGNVTVNSSGSNLVATLTANQGGIFTCILTSGTTAASWSFASMPGQTMDQARMTRASAQTIPTSTDTLVQFDTIQFNQGNIATTGSSAAFTANHAGNYLVTAYTTVTNVTADVRIDIYKNGSVFSSFTNYSSAGTAYNSNFTDVIPLASGDYLNMYMYQDSGSNNTTRTGSDAPRMAVAEIR